MKKQTQKIKIALLLFSIGFLGSWWTNASGLTVFTTLNDTVKALIAKYEKISKERPEDRVYVHVDKPFYSPGETIWLKAYVRDGNTLKSSEMSDIVHVALINPKGNIEKELHLICKRGSANGDFALEESAAGGLYKLRAYTKWQNNDSISFEKEIQVQAVVLPRLKMNLEYERKAYGPSDKVVAYLELTSLDNKVLSQKPVKAIVQLNGKDFLKKEFTTNTEGKVQINFQLPADLSSNDGLVNVLIEHEGNTESISRSIPIVLNKIDLSLLPEGGDLVYGLEGRVAFKALNEFGKPADIEGQLINSKGEVITSLKSFHQGMGAFRFTPIKGETYKVRLTKPENAQQSFALNEILPMGYVLNCDQASEEQLPVNIYSSVNEQLSVVAQIRGKIYFTHSFEAKPGKNYLTIPVKEWPIGVCQLTLFDSKGIARAERLSFVNKHKQLQIEIKTDKEKYQPREKVTMTVYTRDERGIPIPANLSLSVVDDKLLSFANDKSHTILSQLLLQYDIKEKIEEAAFYFDKTEAKATEALDYLLMTSGWRRFTWQQIEENTVPIFKGAEKALLEGQVVDAYTRKKIPNATVSIGDEKIQTNAEGKFSVTGIELYNATSLNIEAKGYYAQHNSVYEYSQSLYYALYPEQDETRYKTYPTYASGAGGVNNRADRTKIPVAAGEKNKVKNAVPADFPGVKRELAPDPALNDELMAIPQAVPVIREQEILKDKIEVNKKEELDILANQPVQLMDGRARKPIMPPRGDAQARQIRYYRARVFNSPDYSQSQDAEIRTDFRSTVYWNPNVQTDRTGKAELSFYNNDDITSFRAIAEGFGADGLVGRSEQVYYTQLPISLSIKVPLEATTGDQLSLPLTLKNNTDKTLNGLLDIKWPKSIRLIGSVNPSVSVNSGEAKVIWLNYEVTDQVGIDTLRFSFKAKGKSDAFVQPIKISAKGFPAMVSFSGSEMDKTYSLDISHPVPGSLQCQMAAYPSTTSNLTQGLESMIREPYGCFEQTSSSNYPNVMLMQYYKESGQAPPSQLEGMLDRGYKRLVSYETKEKGYEWFGGSPGHEALTAYGLLQFEDMKSVYAQVDDGMVSRTSAWLMSRRDGKGGFQRNARALDQFGRAKDPVSNAYIVYALSHTSIGKELMNEFKQSAAQALQTQDAYILALTANAALNLKENSKASELLAALIKLQGSDGSWTKAEQSITCSYGQSLNVETSSLALMALMKAGYQYKNEVDKGIKYIQSNRSGYGGFGSTQGTILALKALTKHTAYSKRTEENGTIEVYIDGKKVAERSYKAGDQEPIAFRELEKYLDQGKHKIRVKYVGVKNPLPYAIAVRWNTNMPNSDKDCKVTLSTSLESKSLKIGETVRMNVTLKNTTADGLPMTMAILGLPAGTSAQAWQLKELTEKKVVDFYEIKDNNLFLYYRQLLPNEEKKIALDLKAEIAGEYEAQASSAYLYYNAELKFWSKPERLTIKP